MSVSAPPIPVLPTYHGPNVRGIIPSLLGPTAWSEAPDWIPEPVRAARQVVLLVLDGLGWEQLLDHQRRAPTIASLTGGPITTVAPTTTATALSSIATGLTPGEHGIVGYRTVLGGEVVNMLRWTAGGESRRGTQPPAEVQPYEAFLGEEVPIVTPADLVGSAFSDAHQRSGRAIGCRETSSIAVEVQRLLVGGERVVYAYYAGVDRIAHERGFGPFYDAELRTADRLVADLLEVLPSGAALLVTADHGQVQVGDNIIRPSAELLKLVSLQSGEGRFRWLHAKPGGFDELREAAVEEFSDTGWVRTRADLIDEGWFGPTVPPPVAARLGDVALVAYEPVSYYDPEDSGPFELICRHGSMTAAEVLVPLVAAMPR